MLQRRSRSYGQGEPQLAKRLPQHSNCGNLAAHPDVTLKVGIEAVVGSMRAATDSGAGQSPGRAAVRMAGGEPSDDSTAPEREGVDGASRANSEPDGTGGGNPGARLPRGLLLPMVVHVMMMKRVDSREVGHLPRLSVHGTGCCQSCKSVASQGLFVHEFLQLRMTIAFW